MTKIAMRPKKKFQKNPTKNNVEQKPLWYLKLDPNFFFRQYHSKADGLWISEHTDFQPLHHKLWENLFSEVGQ